MLSKKRIEALWADELRLNYAAYVPGMPTSADVLRFARLVEAAALENAADTSRVVYGSQGQRWGHGTTSKLLRDRARKARKAAEVSDGE